MLRDWQYGGKPDPVVEDIWKPNVTVAAVVEQNGKFLLVRESANNRIVLNQPAGHFLLKQSREKSIRKTRFKIRNKVWA